MNRKTFWGALFGAHKRFSFDDLHRLYNVLVKNPVVTDANKALIIETYRSIAEFMIWGDQNEPRVFDFFLENNVMVYLHKVLLQPANRRGDVAKQVLQTLSIIIQNVRSETGIFFLFSNNHINNIVELEFDFEDEEVLGYYVSFLKAISLKLNSGTVQFFLDDRGGSMVFPLYTEAIKFAHHKEGMVRAGVRTLTLNVYSVEDHDVQMFVTTSGASTYFAEMSNYIVDQVQSLDRRFQAAQSGTNPNALAALDSQLAEVEDMISYVSDVFSVGSCPVAELVSEQLWTALAGPLMFWPLLRFQLPAEAAAAAAAAASSSSNAAQQESSPTPSRTVSHADSFSHLSRQNSNVEGTGTRISVWCALYLLERLFHIITYAPLLHHMLFALLSCPKVPRCHPANPNRPSPKTLQFDNPSQQMPTTTSHITPALSREPSRLVAMSSLTMSKDSCDNLSALHTPRTEDSDSDTSCHGIKHGEGERERSHLSVEHAGTASRTHGEKELDKDGIKYSRDVLLGIVNGGDIQLVSATLRLLVALLQNKSIAPEPLYLLGLLPPHKMMQLASSSPEATHQRLYAWYQQVRRIQQSNGACYSHVKHATPSGPTHLPGAPPSCTTPPSAPKPTPTLFVMPYDHALSALSLQASLFAGPGHSAKHCGTLGVGPQCYGHLRNASVDSASVPGTSISGSQLGTPDSTPINSKAPSVVDDDAAAGAATAGVLLDLAASVALPLSQGSMSGRKPISASRLGGGPEAEAPGRASSTLVLQRGAGFSKVQGNQGIEESPPAVDRGVSGERGGSELGPSGVISSGVEGHLGGDSGSEDGGKGGAGGPPRPGGEPGLSQVGTVGGGASGVPRARTSDNNEAPGSSTDRHSNSTPLDQTTSSASASDPHRANISSPLPPRPPADANPGLPSPNEALSFPAVSVSQELLHSGAAVSLTNISLTPSSTPKVPMPSSCTPLQAGDDGVGSTVGACLGTAGGAGPGIAGHAGPGIVPGQQQGSCGSFTSLESQAEGGTWEPVAHITAEGVAGTSVRLETAGQGGGASGFASSASQLLAEESETDGVEGSPIIEELLHPRHWPQEEQVLDALMQMLLLQTLPASGMWHASWLLYHLVPCENGRGKWTEQQSSMFRQALGVARDQVLDELSGMWCEALFPLMYMEWPISREAMLRPVLRASSEALLSGPYAYPLCWPQGTGAAPFQLSLSVTAALTAYHTVLRLIALLQMQQLFQQGSIAKSSPTPAVTDADLRQHDIQEGAHVDLHPGAAIPCIVSFAPGQERRVYFAIAGVSMQRLSTMSKDLEQVGGQTVLHSLPVVILADASASRLHSGVVLSVAPLLGSDPATDKNMNRWLHVHVRPPVRGLLRMLKSASAKKGGLLTAMRQLADGHWVLAFPDPDRALNAKMLAQQHAAKLRALYCDVLTPVITTTDQDDSDSILIPAGR